MSYYREDPDLPVTTPCIPTKNILWNVFISETAPAAAEQGVSTGAFYPSLAGGKHELTSFGKTVNKIISQVL